MGRTGWLAGLAALAVACGGGGRAGDAAADGVGDAATPEVVPDAPDAPAADVPYAPDADAPIDAVADVPADVPWDFVPYAFQDVPAAAAGFLCDEAADPVAAPDKTFVHCRTEGADFTAGAPAPSPVDVVAWAYNLERGVHRDEVVARLQAACGAGAPEPCPDVILASELDRGCARSGGGNVPRDLARALGMAYVFAVEFVELRNAGDGVHQEAFCEHGNAVFSRLPLGNVRAVRHAVQAPWYKGPDVANPDEPRLGGRIAVWADLRAGDRILHVAALHLESAVDDAQRTAQAAEVADAALALPYPVLVGGDLNAGLYFLDVQGDYAQSVDPTVQALTDRGFADAHATLPAGDRVTAPENAFVLDLLLGRRVAFRDPGVGAGDPWDAWSDHRPVWVTVRPEGFGP